MHAPVRREEGSDHVMFWVRKALDRQVMKQDCRTPPRRGHQRRGFSIKLTR